MMHTPKNKSGTTHILDSKPLFACPGWKLTDDLVSFPDGRTKRAVQVHSPDWADTIGVTRSGNIVLIKEFRPLLGGFIWKLPGGKVKKGEGLQASAQREFREETGFSARHLTFFAQYHLWENFSIRCNVFIGKGLRKDPARKDADEVIEVHEFPLDKAIEKVLSSSPISALSAAALLHYQRSLQTVRSS